MEPSTKQPSLGRLKKFMGYVTNDRALSLQIDPANVIRIDSTSHGPTMIPVAIVNLAAAFEASGKDIYGAKSKEILQFSAEWLAKNGSATHSTEAPSTPAVEPKKDEVSAPNSKKVKAAFEPNIAIVSLLMGIEPVAKMDKHPGAEARRQKIQDLLAEYKQHCELGS